MASLNVCGARFSYEDPEGETVLLDCGDLLSNKSRIPMHRLPGQNHPIIPEILVSLIQKQQSEENQFALPFGLIDVLLTSRLIRSAKPVKLLEYGSGQGELSAHLAELLGAFREESSLICACDTIEPAWMERISHIKTPPKLSFLAGDFGELGLQAESFDYIVINGLAEFAAPYEVISDAVRLVKSSGTLICYASGAPLLESTFKLFFEAREEYPISPFDNVMLAEKRNCCWHEREPVGFPAQAERDLAEVKKLNLSAAKKKERIKLIGKLQKDIQEAARAGETELKIRLLDEKEALIDRLYAG